MSSRIPFRWTAAIALVAVAGVALARTWNTTSSSNRSESVPVSYGAAPKTQLPMTAFPRVEPGEEWKTYSFIIEPDDVLPRGLRFQVTDGVITTVVTSPDDPDFQILGTRYVPGDLDTTDVTRALWRYIDLSLTKPDGSKASIQVGRPIWWIEELGAKVGSSIDLSMHEVGIEGAARVLSITPIDADSREGAKNGNLVIGKIEHENAVVWDLVFNDDTKEPLGVTANHPLYSQDRDDWVPAGDLEMGEKVRTTNGTATLTGKSQRPGLHKVYNMEVHRSHSYYVSQFGILAHNTGIGCNVGRAGQEISRTSRKVGEKIDFVFRSRNDAMNWAANKLGPDKVRIYGDRGQWIGWQNRAGDKIYWGHGDWYKGPGTSKFPHLNYQIGDQSGHLFLGDKITNTGMWDDFAGVFGL